jgi:enoyl-CoA hydratase/carnithine racemase
MIARITLPGALLTKAAAEKMLEEIRNAHEDRTIRVLLIEAANQMFCTGGDSDIPSAVFEFQTWASKPIVCAVQGAALGPGMAIVANAHVVVAAQGTSFGLTEVRTGHFPIGMQAVANAIGKRRALELALTGRVFGTPEALQMGLIHEMAPAFEYDDRAEATARHLASLNLDGRLPMA